MCTWGRRPTTDLWLIRQLALMGSMGSPVSWPMALTVPPGACSMFIDLDDERRPPDRPESNPRGQAVWDGPPIANLAKTTSTCPRFVVLRGRQARHLPVGTKAEALFREGESTPQHPNKGLAIGSFCKWPRPQLSGHLQMSALYPLVLLPALACRRPSSSSSSICPSPDSGEPPPL